jgi:Cu(I)/Ag(I) efflux system membrane fusion protein
MFNRKLFVTLAIGVAVVATLIAAVLLWPERSRQGAAGGEWTCSMHPQIRQDKPGQCPICGMDLIAVAQLSQLAELERRAGIETEPVTHRELFKEIRTVGKLDYNEGRVALIAARIAGRVDRIYADFTGIQVKKGDHLVDIYSPELFVAQGELLRSLEAFEKATGDRSFAQVNLEAARIKLSLLGILPDQIKEIEKSRKTQTHLTIYAPMGGTVIEKSVRAGQYLKEGDMLYRIADLDPIWLFLDIYEPDLFWVRYGQAVEVSLEAYPAEPFRGVVTFIDPYLDDKSRTVKVRVNLKNPDRRLKPAMYASALIRVRLLPDGTPEPTGLEGKYICPMHPEVVQDQLGTCRICEMQLERVPETRHQPPKPTDKQQREGHGQEGHAGTVAGNKPAGVLAIRATAVLDTGRRRIAYRRNDDGAFELIELELGPLAESKDESGKNVSYYPVLKGLKDGDRVVVRGGFLLDSQRQISGMPSLLYKDGQSATTLHSGHGSTPAKSSAPGGHKH